MIFRNIRLFIVLVFAGLVMLSPGWAKARDLSLIRDAETESIIRQYSAPLFRAAGLNPDNVDILLVKDNSLNAFVANGQNLFIHTGLLMKTETPGELIGVIAHETGHIAGGHLSRIPEALENATAYTLLGALLGGVAAIGGRPDVGAALIAGGQQAGMRNFLQFSRTQETAADQAAVRLLDQTGQSARGLLKFMRVLEGQELLSANIQDPYARTHPLSQERIQFLENHVANSPHSDKQPPQGLQALHHRMRVKLIAFLEPTSRVLRDFADDNSEVGRYARAIALYRKPDTEAALKIMDGLIADAPGDAYFHELKAQILFESGRPKDAIPFYQEAVRLRPDSWQIVRDLARAQIESGDPALLEPAIDNLRQSLRNDPDKAFTWRQLAVAYGRLERMGEASHALAEEALMLGRYREAVGLAERASKLLPRGSPNWLRTEDILAAARIALGKQENQRR